MKKMWKVSSMLFAISLFVGCNVDTDGDGNPDITDQCPTDPNKVEPGQCGCNIEEGSCSNNQDTDGDGVSDQDDLCPADPNKVQPGECGCGAEEGSCDSQDPDPDEPTNKLLTDEKLTSGQFLASENGLYRFYLQGDGNLVLRDQQSKEALWSSKTNGKSGTLLTLQADGNLVLYTDANTPVWDSATNGSNADELRLNDDGSLVLYAAANEVWSVNDSILDNCPDDPNKTEPGLCGCGVVEGTCSIETTNKGKIVYPWNATTAIVKAGERFEVWFDAQPSQTVSAVELQGPYNKLNTTIDVLEGDWVYDLTSGNRYNNRISVTVPASSPADRYDLWLKTSVGYRVSPGAVKVVKEYKNNYYILHISDTHTFQAGSDLSLYKVSSIARMANILDPELVFITGDNLYHPTDERVDQFYNGIPSKDILGLHDFFAATFVACGNHDWQQSGPDDNQSKAIHYNHYYGLHAYNFAYGEGRFMVINDGWGSLPYQTTAAVSWLKEVGFGNFRLGGAHIKDSRLLDLYSKANLDLILVGHNHYIADDNPHPINNDPIQYVANSIRDHAPEFNLFTVNAGAGSYAPVKGPTARVIAIQNPADKDEPSLYQSKLTLSYSQANDGTSRNNIATLHNLFDFPIPEARVRFVMPLGSTYTLSQGTVTQKFDGDSFRVIDVKVTVAANSTTQIRINAR